jgi:hypothetical protein
MFWTFTPFCSKVVVVALYAETSVQALPNASNAGDVRDGVALAVPPSIVRRLAHATASARDFLIE